MCLCRNKVFLSRGSERLYKRSWIVGAQLPACALKWGSNGVCSEMGSNTVCAEIGALFTYEGPVGRVYSSSLKAGQSSPNSGASRGFASHKDVCFPLGPAGMLSVNLFQPRIIDHLPVLLCLLLSCRHQRIHILNSSNFRLMKTRVGCWEHAHQTALR